MQSKNTLQLSVADSSSIGEARRLAVREAERFGFDEEARGRIAIVASELASNLIKHAGPAGGDFLVSSQIGANHVEIQIVVYDRGPGMADVRLCMQDGYSTSGTVGGGLGAISRLPEQFDIYSRSGKGTAIFCSFVVGAKPDPLALSVGGLNFIYPGEDVSGDSYSFFDSPQYTSLLVVDGLGHGFEANVAAKRAIEAFHDKPDQQPQTILENIHRALIGSRGAAVAVARVDHEKGELNYSGLGNIGGQIFQREKTQSLMSLDGIVGQIARRFHSNTYPWSPDSVLMMHSDGLSSRMRFDADEYPGLQLRHPDLVAAVLMRDNERGKDDATVLVAKRDVTRSRL